MKQLHASIYSWLVVIGFLIGTQSIWGQVNYQSVKSLKSLVEAGQSVNIKASLLEGSDGVLYGTSLLGGEAQPIRRGTVFKINKDGSGYTVLRSFSSTGGDGGFLEAAVVEGPGGYLYGTTRMGGSSDAGIIFRLLKDGSGYAVLHEFAGGTGDGAQPLGALVVGNTGMLYGTTSMGGMSNQGCIFRLNPDGSAYSVVHHFLASSKFSGPNQDGGFPSAGLVLAANGILYGTTEMGGDYHSGTLFRMNEDGGNYEVLKRFSRTDGGGYRPGSKLFQGNDGALYGTTRQGDPNSVSVVFKVNLDGSGYTVLKSFTASVGLNSFPCDTHMIQGSNGALYLTFLMRNGIDSMGSIYMLNADGSGIALLKHFSGPDGKWPMAALVQGADGSLYGTTMSGGDSNAGVFYKFNMDGSGFAFLKNLSTTGGEGALPSVALLLASDGALYGTTDAGGNFRGGSIFKINRDGTGHAMLMSCDATNGTVPAAALVEGTDGALYGMAGGGGTYEKGTIFKINKDGAGFAVLKHFTGGADGAASPYTSGLVSGNDGTLFGVTYQGGISNYGTIFKINEDGSGYGVVKSFTGQLTDGAYPTAGLMLGSDQALYGTAAAGGANGAGIIFKIQKNGSGFTVLKHLTFAEGKTPRAALVADSSGVLYGTTWESGSSLGTVFKLNMNGSGFTVLKSFPTHGLEGARPWGVVVGIDGSLYGTTYQGGTSNLGTVFRLSADGSVFETLKSFIGMDGDGKNPYAGLVMSSNGSLYGTTYTGGELGFGTIFSLEPAVAMRSLAKAPSGVQFRMTTGIPGRTYTVQRATSLAGPWTDLTQVTINASGVAEFQDPNPPQDSAFYRTVYQ